MSGRHLDTRTVAQAAAPRWRPPVSAQERADGLDDFSYDAYLPRLRRIHRLAEEENRGPLAEVRQWLASLGYQP